MKMRKVFLALGLVFALLVSSYGLSEKSKSSSPKTVHVKEYTKKDGTVVHAHDRASPGSGSSSSTNTPSYSTVPTTYSTPAKTQAAPAAATTSYTIERDSHGRIKRSSSAKHSFVRTHPCPSTGNTSGACPGYVVDHVQALKHGGRDDPSNMQWQTVAQAKEKDKWE
jgi:hypothetical protein